MHAEHSAKCTQRGSDRRSSDAAQYRGCCAHHWYWYLDAHPVDEAPGLQRCYREARRAAFGQSTARLQQEHTSAAATTLLKIMVDPAAPASVRVRAAESVFTHSAKAVEIEDIEARVGELERVASDKSADSNRRY